MPVERVIPKLWLPYPRRAERVILHWTAGQHTPSRFDLAHYHFIIDGQGRALRGPVAPGTYLPHTRSLNTGSVGLAVAAMAGAVEGKTPYRVPVTMLQVERLCQAAAEICRAYDLALSERTVLCHSEVGRVYGRPQQGKWDIDAVQGFDGAPDALHNWLRRKVLWFLEAGE